jgi:hypothetical protein
LEKLLRFPCILIKRLLSGKRGTPGRKYGTEGVQTTNICITAWDGGERINNTFSMRYTNHENTYWLVPRHYEVVAPL